jgi:hypothetical protein
MKTKNPPFMATTAARQATRPNEIWAIDFAVLDQADRPRIMLVVDVGTRRPLAATVIRAAANDVVATLDVLSRQAALPRELLIDHDFGLNPGLRAWAENHGISVLTRPVRMPQMKALSEPILRDLAISLRDLETPTELGKEIDRWCKSYPAD